MTVGIIGVGLLGGSIGYKLKKTGWAQKVIGIGRSESKLKKAVLMQAVDEYCLGFNHKLGEIDLLIIAVPVQLIPHMIQQALPFLKKGAIITDVGSTKEGIISQVEKILPEHLYFVGGHPLAGSEKTGVESLDPFLFENSIYVIVKCSQSPPHAVNQIKEMIRVLDANVLEMESDAHDLAVAAISHVPHIVAAGLVNCAKKVDNEKNHIFSLAASGFRDTTRIASGSPEMWLDICMENNQKILAIIEQFKREIEQIKEAIACNDRSMILSLLKKAKNNRDQLPRHRKGILSSMIELILFVPDQPGEIGKISNLLGNNNINIKDIEVLQVREDVGGSIRIGLEPTKDAHKAIGILNANGYQVKVLE